MQSHNQRIAIYAALQVKEKDRAALITFYKLHSINKSSIFVDFASIREKVRKKIGVGVNSFRKHLAWLKETGLVDYSNGTLMLRKWKTPNTLFNPALHEHQNHKFDRVKPKDITTYFHFIHFKSKLDQIEYKKRWVFINKFIKEKVKEEVGKVITGRAFVVLSEKYFKPALQAYKAAKNVDTTFSLHISLESIGGLINRTKQTIIKYMRAWIKNGWMHRTKYKLRKIGLLVKYKPSEEEEKEGVVTWKGIVYKQPCNSYKLKRKGSRNINPVNQSKKNVA